MYDINGEFNDTINVVFSEFFGGFVPEVDGKQFNVVGESREDVRATLDDNLLLVSAIWKQMEDNDNRGLMFHMCGFDGDFQQREKERLEKFYGVKVF